jgi:type IV pilus assembly protein PilV
MDVEMKRIRALRRRQRGMTLLEVLVSLLIFSFGVLGMVALQARAVQYSVDAEDRTKAAAIANEIVSSMWAQRTLSLPSATITNFQTLAQNPAAGGLPNAAIAVTSAGGVATVTITWKSPAKRSSDPNSTYFTQVAMP